MAVAPTAGTRITWHAQVPDDGWLSVNVALKPEAWTQEGDGVLFFVGVSDGRAYEQLFSQHVQSVRQQRRPQMDSGDGRSLSLRR